ncbi:unnamed protein product [Oncorhynchus mykiss]|uniref:SOS1/NGEF-like PH domain-containing protein n=1 Tax=Oncorhynchus mykiss TaxID=8022 RepID=A0A060WQF5_ONCMY|nr:unnamed protein product [Oncorhynchus mykiss]
MRNLDKYIRQKPYTLTPSSPLKLHVFLFQDVLVITRAIAHNEQLYYQLYRQPIPVRELQWEDLQDGVIRLGGSIRGAFSNNERTKNFFRVSFNSSSQLHSHSFQASDAFNKQQWLNCIRQAKGAAESAMGVVGLGIPVGVETSISDPEPPPSLLSPHGPLNPITPPLSGPLAPQPKSMDHCDSDSSVDSPGCSMDMDTSEALASPTGCPDGPNRLYTSNRRPCATTPAQDLHIRLLHLRDHLRQASRPADETGIFLSVINTICGGKTCSQWMGLCPVM